MQSQPQFIYQNLLQSPTPNQLASPQSIESRSPAQSKDGNKPKNPMSAYACFIQVIREEHRRKHPNEHVDFSEFSKKCAEKWKTMTDTEKKRFDDMASADRERFNREMAYYTPPEGNGNRKFKKKTPKDPSKPKRAWSAFFFFCDEFRPQVRENHPDWRVGEVAKELGKMWEACGDKSKYENLAQEARQKYEEEMVQYRASSFPTMANKSNNLDENISMHQIQQNQMNQGQQQQQQQQQNLVQQQAISMINNQQVNAQQLQIQLQQLQQQQQVNINMANLINNQNQYVTANNMIIPQHMLIQNQNGQNHMLMALSQQLKSQNNGNNSGQN